MLVVTEIGLAVVLLVGAGLTIRSFARLQAATIGFHPDGLPTLRVEAPKYSPSAFAGFCQQLLERVSCLPAVQSATVASSTPLSSNSSSTSMRIKGRPEFTAAVGVHSVAPDHFKTLRVPLLSGRSFTDQDRAGAPLVAIVNETGARRFWPDENPIGRQIWVGAGWEQDQFAEIIGVVGDVKYGKVEEAIEPDVYLPYLQPTEPASFVI